MNLSEVTYKYCVVPYCKSTTIRTPHKLFIFVPRDRDVRRIWFQLAGRTDADTLPLDSRIYFCEDHFELPTDMKKHMRRLIGKVPWWQITVKHGFVPTKFPHQVPIPTSETPDTVETLTETVEEIDSQMWKRVVGRPNVLRKREITTVPKTEPSQPMENIKISTAHVNDDIQDPKRRKTQTIYDRRQSVPLRLTKVTSASCKDENVQLNPSSRHVSKVPTKLLKTIEADHSYCFKLSRKMIMEFDDGRVLIDGIVFNKEQLKYDGDTPSGDFSDEPELCCDESIFNSAIDKSSVDTLDEVEFQSRVDDILESSENIVEKIENQSRLADTELSIVKNIENKPLLYIGLPDTYYYILDIISNNLNINKVDLMYCLAKIRLNDKLDKLSDEFNKDSNRLDKIFLNRVPFIAHALKKFIAPMRNDHPRRHTVNCIIDCLEIEIKTPKKFVNYDMSWSESKKANTLKYLISCTPNGLINYVSPGFGGSVSDTRMVESCAFVSTLDSGMSVVADRGFRHLEKYLKTFKVTVLRISNHREMLIHQMANLRVRMGTVLGRLRDFHMLKPRACAELKYMPVINDIVLIACALVNLQLSVVQ